MPQRKAADKRARPTKDQEVAKLRVAISRLVDLYVANQGTSGEFIRCITPKQAAEMTRQAREACEVWSAWDASRKAIGEL